MKKYILLSLMLIFSVSLSAAAVVKDGKVLFQGIVVPDNPVPVVTYAAQELAYHLKHATGKTLPVIKESAAKAGEKYFYLGNCKANAALNPSKLPWNTGIGKINRDSIQFAGNDGTQAITAHTNSTGTLFAVYEFLEKYLGVRWIWPGASGEVIPKCKNLSIKETSFTGKPLLRSSVWRSNPASSRALNGWSSMKAMKKYYQTEYQWLLRHRFSCDRRISGGHAFTKYYDRYFKQHPEYFSMLPDGVRRHNIYKWSKNPRNISMCVSNPELAKLVVKNWLALRKPEQAINANENDSSGECTCDNCLTADNSPIPNAQRRAAALKEFNKKSRGWPNAMGSVSDRYCKFFLAVQKEADKTHPNHVIIGQIYANYSLPPTDNIKLNERIILRFCPPVMYPFTRDKIDRYKFIAGGWAKTGVRLQFRPNYTWCGHYFPIQYHEAFYEMFTSAIKYNMYASDMDSLTGQYMVHGLVNYVIASLNHRPDAPLEQLKDEFFSSFGAAKAAVKKYFDYVTWLTMEKGFSDVDWRDSGLEGGMKSARYMIYAGDRLFKPEVMAKCFQLLDEAAGTPGLDKKSAYRVQMLRHGLKQMELAMKVQAEYRKCQNGAPLDEFNKAHAELQKFRFSIEKTCLANMAYLYYYDNLAWFKPIREKTYLKPAVK